MGLGRINVQEEGFSIEAEIASLQKQAEKQDDEMGAIASFIGQVRGNFDENSQEAKGTLSALHLQHYPGMSERILSEIRNQAMTRWPLQGATIIHRIGRLIPGDEIVLVITASSHRKAAFQACEFLMDWLKTDAPFWKAEEAENGELHWVKAKDKDKVEKEKWNR